MKLANNIGNRGTIMIGESLKTNTSLIKLNLCHEKKNGYNNDIV